MTSQFDKIIDNHEIYDQHELQRKKTFVSPVWRVLDGLSLVLAYSHFIGGSWVLEKVTNLPRFCRVVSFVIYFLNLILLVSCLSSFGGPSIRCYKFLMARLLFTLLISGLELANVIVMQKAEGRFIEVGGGADVTKVFRLMSICCFVIMAVIMLLSLVKFILVSRHLHYRTNHLVKDKDANKLDVEISVPLARLQRAHLH